MPLDSRSVAYWEKQPGFIYFIGAGDPSVAVKIGISTQATMRKRLRQLQSSNHEPLTILGVIAYLEGVSPMAQANAMERKLHDKFQSERRFTSGPGNEWFNATRGLLAFVAAETKPPEESPRRR